MRRRLHPILLHLPPSSPLFPHRFRLGYDRSEARRERGRLRELRLERGSEAAGRARSECFSAVERSARARR